MTSSRHPSPSATAGFLSARFEVPVPALDLLSGALWEVGTLGFEYRELQDGKRVEVTAYFPPATQPASVVDRLIPWLKAAGVEDVRRGRWQSVPAQNWRGLWKSAYRPIEVGQRLAILPSWSRQRMPGRGIVKISPRMAFGTGSHETTHLCLEALEASAVRGACVADIGTGSGILALAALQLGAARVDACDTDPLALENARHNRKLNQAGEGMHLYAGDIHALPDHATYDCIVANLVLEPLRDAMPSFARRLRETGELHLSGLLEGQDRRLAPAIRAAGLHLTERRERNDWLLLTCRRDSASPA